MQLFLKLGFTFPAQFTRFDKKPASMQSYKYLEMLIFIYLKCSFLEGKADACMQFATVL